MANSLELILAHLPGCLGSEQVRADLLELASGLPHLPHGLLECRLAHGDHPVDLSIAVAWTPRPLQVFSDYLSRRAHRGRHRRSWLDLERFCSEVPIDMDSRGKAGTWLEFDLDSARNGLAPSAFVPLWTDRTDSTETVDEALRRTLRSLDPAAAARVIDLRVSLPEAARPSYLGVMFCRPGYPVRLNIAGFSTNSALDWLDRHLGARLHRDFRQTFSEVFELAGEPVAVVEISGNGPSFVGLECAPSRMEDVLRLERYLCERHLCDPDKSASIREWPGHETAASNRRWPTQLVLEALMSTEGRPDALVRRLNHIKISFGDRGPREAKIYLGFGHIVPRLAPVT